MTVRAASLDVRDGQPVAPPAGQLRQIARAFARHRPAMAGLVVMVALVVLAVLAPVIAGHDPNAIDLAARNQPPGARHWFGTDLTGRDEFARTVYGARISLLVGTLAVAISVVVGVLLGAVAGFFRGPTDDVVMRVTDLAMTFPPIVIILTAAALVGPGITNTILLIGLLGWPTICRLVRAKLLSIREQQFIEASRALGLHPLGILTRHALPNVADVVIVYTTLGVAQAILLEAGLSFLGLGVQPPAASWGNLLNTAREATVLELYPWQWLPAGVAVVVTVLAVNLIGDGLRDAFDPGQS